MVDADAWQIGGQNETYILYFLPPVQKTFPRHWLNMRLIFTQNLRTN